MFHGVGAGAPGKRRSSSSRPQGLDVLQTRTAKAGLQDFLLAAMALDLAHAEEKTVDTLISAGTSAHVENVDEAYEFLRSHAGIEPTHGEVDLEKLLRKVDWHVLPILFLVYGIQFLDKFLFNYAIIMGMAEDLKLHGNQLNDAASALWEAYLVASIPVAIILNKLPVAKWLGLNIMFWGIAVSCMAAVQNFGGLLALRILLGFFDSTIAPACTMITSQYFRKNEQAMRFSWWYSCVGFGLILGGLISFGFQHVTSSTLEGWRIMFLVLGLVSLFIGVAALLFLPDTPMHARFLTDAEKTTLLNHVAINATGVANRKIKARHMIEVFTDVQIWLLAFAVACCAVAAGIVSIYSSTLIKGAGYTSKESALLNMPTGGVAMIAILAAGYLIGATQLPRWLIFVGCNAIGITGAGIMSFMPRSNKAALLAGLYVATFGLPSVMIMYQWTAANVAGHTKRAISLTLMSAAFAVGNIAGPYVVQKKDAPDFEPARITIMSMHVGASFLVCLLALYYLWSNKRRDKIYGEVHYNRINAADVGVWENLTDKERSTFRYVY